MSFRLNTEIQIQHIVERPIRLSQTLQGAIVLDLRILGIPLVDFASDLRLICDELPAFQG